MSGSLSPDQQEIGPPPAPSASSATVAPVITMPRTAAEDDDDPPTGSSDRALLLYMLRKADAKRDEQIDATRELARAMTAHNDGATSRHQTTLSTVTDAMSRSPGRWEFRALGAALVALVFWLVALYAQSNGQDAGKAADDARRALPSVSHTPASAEPETP